MATSWKARKAERAKYMEFVQTDERRGDMRPNAWAARIEGGYLWYEDCQEVSVNSPLLGDMIEYDFVVEVFSLAIDLVVRENHGGGHTADIPLDMRMTLRAELRGNLVQWYAFKDSAGGLRKLYAGHSEDINGDKLVALAKRFNGYV